MSAPKPPQVEICPRYEAAAELLGKRWTGLILRVLLAGPQRFSQMAAALEHLSERVLSERLKELEEHGIVERRVHPTTPVQITYSLTEKGQALGAVVDAIGKWAEDWVELTPQTGSGPAGARAGGRARGRRASPRRRAGKSSPGPSGHTAGTKPRGGR